MIEKLVRPEELSPEKAWSQPTENVSMSHHFSNLEKAFEISHLWSSPVLRQWPIRPISVGRHMPDYDLCPVTTFSKSFSKRGVAQQLRTPARHAGGRGFESRRSRQVSRQMYCSSKVGRLTADYPLLSRIPSAIKLKSTTCRKPRAHGSTLLLCCKDAAWHLGV